MHLLATTSGVAGSALEPVDLDQTAAEIVVISAADSELASLARASDGFEGPSLRLANLLQLQHNIAVDLYIGKTLSKAKLIVLRLLGGAAYWSYGLAEIEDLARRERLKLAVLPGDANPDPQLLARSTLPLTDCERLRQYLAAGGATNTRNFLAYCAHLQEPAECRPRPRPCPRPASIARQRAMMSRLQQSSSTGRCWKAAK
jgi:cobaltochelatase CobN